MALFSKQNKEAFIKPLNGDNPVLVQVLGICSALAVTSQLKPAIVMGLAVTIITAFSNVIISIIRNTIPQRIRIIVQLVVVGCPGYHREPGAEGFRLRRERAALCVCGSDHHQLYPDGSFEAFAMMNKPWPSFLDGVGNGLGYALIPVIVGAVREFLGRGSCSVSS